MDRYPGPMRRCLEVLRKLPGVGPKSAQRILFHLLAAGPGGLRELAGALEEVASRVDRCPSCRVYRGAGEACPFCEDPKRDRSVLCVVETAADLFLVEETGDYRGRYFVLHGLLSPLKGVGPDDLGLPMLDALLAEGGVEEVILATPPTSEGEATAAFLAAHLGERVRRLTRIAYGLPVGADFQYVDPQTLARAFSGRKDFSGG